MSFSARDFEALHAGSPDPWAFRTRWYEQRKRALTLAALPERRYDTAFEPGCSIGELSLELAPRCRQLIAWDVSPTALAAATAAATAASVSNLRFELRSIPLDWPAGPLDLIVLSEVGYFLDAAALPGLVRCVEQSLTAEGTLLLCHWLHPIEHGEIDGADVHRCFVEQSALHVISRVDETDFQILVMTRDGRSVTARERPA